jgi:hypothetical protein
MVLIGFAVAACGGRDESARPSSSASTTSVPVDVEETEATDGVLRDASEVRAEEAVDGATYRLGEVATIDGISIRIDTLEVGGDDAGPWIVAVTTVENRSGVDANVPYLEIHCSGQEEGGGWQADSTLTLGAALPSQTVDTGVVHLLVPGDGRFGEPRPVCAPPAVVRVVDLSVNFAIPDSMVTEVNAASPTAVIAVDDEPAATLTPPPDPTTATLPTTSESASGEGADVLDILVALDEAGVSCADPTLVSADPDAEAFGFTPPQAEYECASPDVGRVTIARWADATTMRGVLRAVVELSAGFSQNISDHAIVVVDDRTVFGPDSEESVQSDEVRDWLERAQDAVGGDVRTFAEIIEG